MGVEPHDRAARMNPTSGIAQLQVEHLIEAISDRGLSAGSGAAGAVTLALAAACAAKAATISFKHQPKNTDLTRLRNSLEELAQFALAGGDRDAQAFAVFVKEHTPGAASELQRQGAQTLHLIDVLCATVDQLAPQIEPTLAGDLVAARALMAAARTIQVSNSAEAGAAQSQRQSGSRSP